MKSRIIVRILEIAEKGRGFGDVAKRQEPSKLPLLPLKLGFMLPRASFSEKLNESCDKIVDNVVKKPNVHF